MIFFRTRNYIKNEVAETLSAAELNVRVKVAKNHSKIQNYSLLSVMSLSTAACNSTSDDQCYGGLGIIIGSICANQNNVVQSDLTPLDKVSNAEVFELTTASDEDGNARKDTVEFSNSNEVIGTKYTLTTGDIIKNPGLVFLNLVNSGAIDGQDIFGAQEIELSTQGTTVVLATKWKNINSVVIKDSDQSVTLNNLQATKLDSNIASDNSFYPGTSYKLENINAPDSSVFLFFNDAAILGTSTELDVTVKDSKVSIQAGVFVDPNPPADEGDAVDPFAVAADVNIENLNLTLDDQNLEGSIITDIVFSGLETLNLMGGKAGNNFEITNPLDATLKEINASDIETNLKLNVSDSVGQKTILLGIGNDQLVLGDSLVAGAEADNISGGDGVDSAHITFGGEIVVGPKLSSFEDLHLSFNGASTLDFDQISEVQNVNLLSSTAGVTLTNIPFDLTLFSVTGAQAGDWSLSYEENAAANPIISWLGNTGATTTVASLVLDEARSFSLNYSGSDNIAIDLLALDPDDTYLLSITNTDDGNVSISSGVNIDTADGLSSLSLTSTEGGDVSLGSAAGGFGISEAPKLESLVLNASSTGKVELGNIGTSVKTEDLQSVSITSSGADILLGSISASNAGTMSISVSSSATLSLGNIDFSNAGTSLSASGSGKINPITFTNEAYSTINFVDILTDTSTSFVNANNGVTIITGSGNDTISGGLAADNFTGNDGIDTFVIANSSTGITSATADIITDFKSGTDKLKLGLAGDATSGTGNYIESTNIVDSFTGALAAANTALNSLNGTSSAAELYAFEYDNSYGYLFVDTDSDGAADDVILLSGVESSLISSTDIIA